MISRGDGAFAPRVTVVHQEGDDDGEADRDLDGEALMNGWACIRAHDVRSICHASDQPCGSKSILRAAPLDKADLAVMFEASGVSARVVGSASDVESELPFFGSN